jgi:hypothetical protein
MKLRPNCLARDIFTDDSPEDAVPEFFGAQSTLVKGA